MRQQQYKNGMNIFSIEVLAWPFEVQKPLLPFDCPEVWSKGNNNTLLCFLTARKMTSRPSSIDGV